MAHLIAAPVGKGSSNPLETSKNLFYAPHGTCGGRVAGSLSFGPEAEQRTRLVATNLA